MTPTDIRGHSGVIQGSLGVVVEEHFSPHPPSFLMESAEPTPATVGPFPSSFFLRLRLNPAVLAPNEQRRWSFGVCCGRVTWEIIQRLRGPGLAGVSPPYRRRLCLSLFFQSARCRFHPLSRRRVGRRHSSLQPTLRESGDQRAKSKILNFGSFRV